MISLVLLDIGPIPPPPELISVIAAIFVVVIGTMFLLRLRQRQG